MAKYYDKRTLNHEQALAWVKQQIIAMGCAFNETHIEAGIDAFAELADPNTGEAQASFFGVQIKTCEQFDAETDEKFSFYPEAKHINYWNASTIPVLLVVCRAKTEEAYAVWVQEYFRAPDKKDSKTVIFQKERDRFRGGDDWQRRLVDKAVPRSRGLSFPPVPMPEELGSNLLEVVPPEQLYCGKTRFKNRESVLNVLEKRDFKGTEFIIRDGYLWSVRSLHLNVWNDFVDTRTVRTLSFAELALHDQPAKRRHAVELLNHCLTSRLAMEDIFWLNDEKIYVYLPSREATRTVRTTVQREKRESKKGLLHVTKKGEEVRWCRHIAMKACFVEIGGRYYLEIDPTYYYTRDGKKKHRKWQDFIRNARIMEKQREYWANLGLWRHVLTHPDDMLHEDYVFLKFGDYIGFSAPVSIPDEVWNPQSKQQQSSQDQTEFQY
jgi:hypothetical protein